VKHQVARLENKTSYRRFHSITAFISRLTICLSSVLVTSSKHGTSFREDGSSILPGITGDIGNILVALDGNYVDGYRETV